MGHLPPSHLVPNTAQGSVATRPRCGGINDDYYKFTAASHDDRILKIGRYLDKLWVTVLLHLL